MLATEFLWELSDGRLWYITLSRGSRRGTWHASSVLSDGHYSAIGDFRSLKDVEAFALNYLRLTVVERISNAT